MMDRGIWRTNAETSPTCPRCGSTNTKFCYYNNYSLTQPRYFCKSCRRYWTNGGSLRNVPVGDGCRKTGRSSRSGKPNNNTRASSSIHHHDGVNISRDYFSSSGRGDIITYCSTGSLAPPVAGADDDGRPTIDLALVYSNFLNPILEPSSEQTEPIIPELPNVVGPPVPPTLQFSGAPEQTTMNTNTAGVFLECRSFSNRSSSENEQVTDGNPFYFGGGMNSFEKQQTTTTTTVDHHHQMNNTNDYLLLPPYLAGEETMSEEMVWPTSDLICPGDPVIDADYESSKGILPQLQDSNQVDEEDGNLSHIPNYGTIYSGLDHK